MKNIVIVCHDSMPGPPHETLRDYFLDEKIANLVFIGHVNQYVKGNPIKSSYCNVYKNGKKIKAIISSQFLAPEPVIYLHDLFLTCYWTIKHARKVDLFVGLSNLNCIVGVLFKIFKKVDTVVYYVIDYVPVRFQNRLMNSIYHYLDNICAEYSNATWNYGIGMIKAREKRWKKTFPNQLHVPHGVTLNKTIIKESASFDMNTLVYMGTLYEQQGLQIVIKSLPSIIKKFPKLTLLVIGLGPYEGVLKKLALTLKVADHIQFLGFIEDTNKVDTIISKCSLALATYKNDIGFVVYTEPGKVKRYLACGVPVIITKGTPLEELIQKELCGVVVSFDKEDVSMNIQTVLQNKKLLLSMRKNAISTANKYRWDVIYAKALSETLHNYSF